MGEIADMMIDGNLCEGCGCLMDGDAPGYPVRCEDCQRRDVQAKQSRRDGAQDELDACCVLAGEHGMRIARHSDSHLAITHDARGWLLNFYPGNGRLYADENKQQRPPYIDMQGRKPTLRQVIEALIVKI